MASNIFGVFIFIAKTEKDIQLLRSLGCTIKINHRAVIYCGHSELRAYNHHHDPGSTPEISTDELEEIIKWYK